MPETWVQSLVWEDPLEKGKATHSSILAWRIPWTRLSDFHFHFTSFEVEKNLSSNSVLLCNTDILNFPICRMDFTLPLSQGEDPWR